MTVISCVFQDFAIQQVERRINRMQGEQSNEEKLHLEAKIKELTEELEQKTSTHHLLSLQLKRLQVNWRLLTLYVLIGFNERKTYFWQFVWFLDP